MNIQDIKEIKVMQFSLMLMRIPYMFPSKAELKANKSLRGLVLKFFITNLSSVYFSIGAALHMAVSVENGIYDYIEKDIGNIISYHGASYFIYRYILNIKYVVILYKQFSDFETFGKPTDFDNRNKHLNKLSKIYIVYHTIVVGLMCTMNLIYNPQCKEINLLKNQHEICGLPAPTWLPIKFDYFPVRELVFFYEVFSVFIVYQTAGFLSFCMFETLQHLVIRFNHVGDTFINALNEKNRSKRRFKFNKAVKYHQAVIEMGYLVNKCFSPCMMVHISLTGPFIGVAGYAFLTKIPVDTTALLIGWMISTFIVCHGGQKLMEASENIGKIMLKLNWYNLEVDLQKELRLVILRSKKPIYLRAGPFGPITYSTVSTILKTSYSYVTLLNQTM